MTDYLIFVIVIALCAFGTSVFLIGAGARLMQYLWSHLESEHRRGKVRKNSKILKESQESHELEMTDEFEESSDDTTIMLDDKQLSPTAKSAVV